MNLILRPHDLHWLDPAHEERDLCAHGSVEIHIGNDHLSDSTSGDWCVSAAALYLLRTLTRDHTPASRVGSQLVPCCGHAMFHQADDEDVIILGCPNGVDWDVQHSTSHVVLRTPSGIEEMIDSAAWNRVVLTFADAVEHFYAISKPKEPTDTDDAAGYAAFWAEWRRRYITASIAT